MSSEVLGKETFTVTREALREAFEAEGFYYTELNDSAGGELKNPDVEEYLKEKGLVLV